MTKGQIVFWYALIGKGQRILRWGTLERVGSKEAGEEHRVYIRCDSRLYVVNRSSLLKEQPNVQHMDA